MIGDSGDKEQRRSYTLEKKKDALMRYMGVNAYLDNPVVSREAVARVMRVNVETMHAWVRKSTELLAAESAVGRCHLKHVMSWHDARQVVEESVLKNVRKCRKDAAV